MATHRFSKNVFWYTAQDPSDGIALSEVIRADAVVVGGGMAGLSCAQRLSEAGMDTVLVERDFCGAGASGKTSGFITPDSEIELSSLIARHGPENARRIWEFVLSGVSAIRRTIKRHRIECDYQIQDSLFIANNAAGETHIVEEHRARQSLGYASRRYTSRDVRQVIGSSDYVGAVRYPDTFGINSYRYCQALRQILLGAGVRIYEATPVTRIHAKGVDTAEGAVRADNVIVCADRFIPDFGMLKKEIYHVQTFLGISKPLSDADVRRVFPDGCMMTWDTDLVYNYFRLTGQNRVLLGGGDLLYIYARGVSDNTPRFERRLAACFRKKFPGVPLELEYVWPGMLGVSKDLLPIMGADETKRNVWYVGAATGLPWAAALGIYAAERITRGRNELDGDFSWRRKFVIGPRLQALLTTPLTYAVSHGIAKYL